MAQNKVQYQRGLPMLEFIDLYGSQERCEEAVRGWRRAQGFVCPRCQSTWHSEFRRNERLFFQCSGCRHQCSLTSGTIFDSTKLPLTKWFIAMHLMTQAKNNVSALELKRHMGVSYPTAWLIKHKLMEVMFQREESRQLTGRVEIDDAVSSVAAGQGADRRTRSPSLLPYKPLNRVRQSCFVCRAAPAPKRPSKNSPKSPWPLQPPSSPMAWDVSPQCVAVALCISSTLPAAVPPASNIRRSWPSTQHLEI